MKKHFFFFLFLISSFLAAAQTYNYIGVEDGLSNRLVYAIQKGPKGYMWFLTHDGIDRYNGKEFKHYKLMDGEDEINSMMNLNWLYSDACSVMKASTTVSNWYINCPKAKRKACILPSAMDLSMIII